MPLDYYIQSKDTGFNDAEAIQPVKNGEDANEDTFERPSENLRTRTEDIRKQFDLLEAVAASDRGLTVVAATDAYVDWDSGTGVFDVNDNQPSASPRDFYIMPLLGLAEGGGGAPGAHAPATYVYYDSVGGGAFTTCTNATLRDHGDTGASRRSGANNVFMRIDESTRTTGGVVISVEGDDEVGPTFPADGPVTIVVELEQGGNTAAEIVAALQAAGDHDTYINTGATYTKVLAAGDCTVEVTRRRFADGDIYDDGGGNVYHSYGAMDPEGILIDNTTLASFFADTDNALHEGDVLVVNFTGADDRLNNQTDSSMTGMLKKLTSDAVPDMNTWLFSRRHVIPVCKVFDGNLYFLNGTMFESGKPGRLIPDPGDVVELRADYEAHVAGTADQHADADITAEAHAGTGNPAVTTLPVTLPGSSEVRTHIDELLKALDRHMDGTVVNFKHPEDDVTTASKVRDKFTLSGTDVGAQLGELADAIDDHMDGSVAAYKHPYIDIVDRPFVTVGSDSDADDYTSLGAAVVALSSLGGGTIVLVDDLTENVNITAVAPGTVVLGNGHSLTGASGAAPVITIAGETAQRQPGLVIQDLNILSVNDQKLLSMNTSALATSYANPINMPVTFRNCFFQTHSSGTEVAFFVRGELNLIECTIDGQAQTRAAFEYDTHATVPHQYPSVLRVDHCRVLNFLQLVSVGTTAARYQTLRLTDCELVDAVYSDGSNNRILIDLGSATQVEVVVERNRIVYGNGLFIKCKVYAGYTGIIADNYFDCSYTQDVEEMYAITAHTDWSVDTERPFVIRNNQLDLNNKLCGIYAEECAVIEGNTFRQFGHNASSGITEHYGIRVPDTFGRIWVENNTFEGDTTTLNGTNFTCIQIGASGGTAISDIHISNNHITTPYQYAGIRIYEADDVNVSGNIIRPVSSPVTVSGLSAIYITSTGGSRERAVVSGNICEDYSVTVNNNNSTISGNTLRIEFSTVAGISFNGDNTTVSGNRVEGGQRQIFINSGADNFAVTGNTLIDGDTGIYVLTPASSYHGVVTGNVATGSTTNALYVANNCYLGLSGNVFQKATNYAVDMPATSNNIGVGIPGSCTWTGVNWYSSATTH